MARIPALLRPPPLSAPEILPSQVPPALPPPLRVSSGLSSPPLLQGLTEVAGRGGGMFVEEPRVPPHQMTAFLLCPSAALKGQEALLSLLAGRERALKGTFGAIPDGWGGQRTPPEE